MFDTCSLLGVGDEDPLPGGDDLKASVDTTFAGEVCMLKKSKVNPSTSTAGDLDAARGKRLDGELDAVRGKKTGGESSGEEVLVLGKNSLTEVDQRVCDCLQEASSKTGSFFSVEAL